MQNLGMHKKFFQKILAPFFKCDKENESMPVLFMQIYKDIEFYNKKSCKVIDIFHLKNYNINTIHFIYFFHSKESEF